MNLAFFRDPCEVGTPTTKAIRWLIDMGASIESIGDFGAPPETAFAVGAARVSFEPSGRYVPLPAMGTFAYILPSITLDGIVDLVAWQPTTGRVATRLGVAGLVGE